MRKPKGKALEPRRNINTVFRGNHVAESQRTITASFDGACQPCNPGGHMGLGWVIGDQDYHDYVPPSSGNSNNVAEYMALIRLLETVAALPDPGLLRISGDSQLVVEQINGEWRVRAGALRSLHAKAQRLIEELTRAGWKVSLDWVNRTENTRADLASTAALGERGIEFAQYDPSPGYTTGFRDMAKNLEISAIGLGRVLDELGLRNGKGGPTPRAISEEYAQVRFNGFGRVADWHEERVKAAVAEFIKDEKRAAAIRVKRTQPKRAPIRAQHLCGHETEVGLRPSKKLLAEVRASLCKDCQRGDKAKFARERSDVIALCERGDTLADAVETVVEDKRLRPSVFLACWGWWAHRQHENVLDRIRGTCEKPGWHPDVLASEAALKRQRESELNRLIRAAINA